jgi:hypothetical protein
MHPKLDLKMFRKLFLEKLKRFKKRYREMFQDLDTPISERWFPCMISDGKDRNYTSI